MAAPALLLLIATLAPLLGAGVLAIIGRRMGAPLAGWVASSLVIASFAITMIAMGKWYDGKRADVSWGMGVRPILRTTSWIPAGPGPMQAHPGFLDAGVYVDSLTIAMFAMVTTVGAIVHLYSIGAMQAESRHSDFFVCLGILQFSVMSLCLSATLVQMLACWQLIGIAGYPLVGFYFDQPAARRSARKIFLAARLGDAILWLGLCLLLSRVCNATLPHIWTLLGDAASGGLPVVGGVVLSKGFLTTAGILMAGGLLIGASQFPIMAPLARAVTAPPAAIAMLCSVGPLAGAVYLLARLYPLFTPDVRLFIAIIGLLTLITAGCIAAAQEDIKRLLAWSTVSQAGCMMLAIGVGSWTGALLLLIAHAFFKSLLLLAAGSAVDALRGQSKLSEMGGLWRKMPVTTGAFLIGALTLSGVTGLSGSYSMHVILGDAGAFAQYAKLLGGRSAAYNAFFVLPLVGCLITAFYAMRCTLLAFGGAPRDIRRFARASEHPGQWAPMLALAVLSIIAGFAMNIPDLLRSSMTETRLLCDERLMATHAATRETAQANPPRFTAFDQAWPVRPASDLETADWSDAAISPPSLAAQAHERGHELAHGRFIWMWGIGMGAAILIYWNGIARANWLLRLAPLRWLRIWLLNEMFLGDLYTWTIARLWVGLTHLALVFERHVLGSLPPRRR